MTQEHWLLKSLSGQLLEFGEYGCARHREKALRHVQLRSAIAHSADNLT